MTVPTTKGPFIMQNHHPNDIIAAAPDAIALALGEHIANPHPLAAEMVHSPLSILADACERKAQRPGSPVRAVLYTTTDFASALASGVQQTINRRFHAQAEHRKFCGELTVRDFKRVELPELDMANDLRVVCEMDEFDQYYVGTPPEVRADQMLKDVCLMTFGRLITLSRQIIKNDQVGLILDILNTLGNAGARTEAMLLYQELEINPFLADQDRVFIDGFNKLSGELDETNLAAGIAAMRKFKTPAGNYADLKARHLLVSAENEFTAHRLVHQSGLDIEVTASARLKASRWYLFSDPEQHAACATLKLFGSNNNVLVESVKRFTDEGVSIRARADLGAVILGRMGAIRGGAD